MRRRSEGWMGRFGSSFAGVARAIVAPAFFPVVPAGRVNIVRVMERIPRFSVCICTLQLYGREQVREISVN